MTNKRSAGLSQRDVNSNERHFCKCTSSKRKAKENVGLLFSGVGDVMAKGVQMSKVINASLISVFTGKVCLLDSLRSQAY